MARAAVEEIYDTCCVGTVRAIEASRLSCLSYSLSPVSVSVSSVSVSVTHTYTTPSLHLSSSTYFPSMYTHSSMYVPHSPPLPPTPPTTQHTTCQAFGPEASRSIDVFRRVMATEGARGFFRGWVAAQLTWIPYFALYFGFYERVKQAAMDVTGAKTENEVLPGTFLLCGTVAGTVAGAITCPLDVVKTRIQVGLHYPAASGGGSGSGSGSG